MTFLNGMLLGGALAFLVPLLIHLFHRSRFRAVHWGAMHLLESAVRMNRRRIRIEQWLLLALRCAIPVALAACMAQPVLIGLRPLAGDVPASAVLVLDDSYSMQARPVRQSNFHQALAAASQVLRALPRGSQVSAITMGKPAPVLESPTFDVGELAEQLGVLHADQGPVRAAAALEAAAAIMAGMTHAQRDLVVISDFQRADWLGISPQQRRQLRERLEQLKPRPAVTLWSVSQAAIDNVCVESLELSRQLLGVGQSLSVQAHLRNHGRRVYEDLRLVFRVDGQQRDVAQIPLPAHSEGQALFTCAFDQAGSHVVEVEAEAEDLRADNSHFAAVTVLDRIPVLVVNGDPSPQPLRGETDYLEVALQPFARGGDKLADLIQARVAEPARFDRRALEGVRVVVLANVARPTELQVAALRGFVRGGGGLLVFPGNRVDLEWYHRLLSGGSSPLLPMAFAATAGSLDDPASGSSIVAERFQHPAMALFNDRRNGNLADAQVWMWYRLARPTAERSEPGAPAQVLARLASGDPLIVEARRGDGRVIQVATACDADWSNLPLRPFYLPLVQQLTTYLASTWDPPRNVELGQPLVALLDPQAGPAVTLTDSRGRKHALQAVQRGNRRVVEFPAAEVPGLYTLEPAAGRPLHFAITAPRRESRLDPLSQQQLQQLAADLGASVVRSAQQYARWDRARRHGRPLWQPLLAVVLAMLFGELLVEQWWSREWT